MTLKRQVLAWDRHKNVGVLNQPSRLDNWILQQQFMYKQTIKKPAHILFHSKIPHTITKMNDNIHSTVQ